MFELPPTKRVRRSELETLSSRSSSPSSDRETEAVIRERLRILLGNATAVEASETSNAAGNADSGEVNSGELGKNQEGERKEDEANPKEDEDAEALFAFKLFSSASTATSAATTNITSQPRAETTRVAEEPSPISATNSANANATSAVQYIRLSPPPTTGSSSILTKDYPLPERPLSYYLAPPLSPSKRAEYADVALTGEFIQSFLAQQAWPGMSYPWRVTHISTSTSPRSFDESNTSTRASHNIADPADSLKKRKKTRLGKKSRIKIRIKHEIKRAKQDEKKKEEQAKEVHMKEKKARLNRMKQLKKREKNRLKKGDGEGGDSLVDGSQAGGEMDTG